MRRLPALILSLVAVACAILPATASAAAGPPPDVAAPLFSVTNVNQVPPGFTISAKQAIAVAETSPKMQAIHGAHHPLHVDPILWVRSHYEIQFFFDGKAIADQTVTANGHLGPLYTGPSIDTLYARGHYGDIFDSPWVLASFTFMFLLPLALLRRRAWMDRVDLAMLLSFGVSYALFDTTHLEAGVWLFYPSLIYLLVRMVMRGMRTRRAGTPLDCRLPTAVLVIGLALLTAGRIFVNLHPQSVMDVGTASVLGAYKIIHGQSIYYFSFGHGDTYGPLSYLAYVPFELIWPGNWIALPAARAAAITFDLLTIAGLIWLGIRLRTGREGRRLGLLLAWLWAACPFSLLGLEKSTNDGLTALIVVLILLALSSPIKRGILVGVGAASKFFPAILLPLVAVGHGDADQRTIRKVLVGFVITVGATIAVFLPSGGLAEMWDHTLGFQLTRSDVFSIWALHPTLAPLKDAVEAFAVILSVVVAFRPNGRRTTAQVAALAAAVVIAVQLTAIHWFYLYIVWFLPLVLVAVLGDVPARAEPDAAEPSAERFETDEPSPVLAGAA
jgi:hypothetical protein